MSVIRYLGSGSLDMPSAWVHATAPAIKREAEEEWAKGRGRWVAARAFYRLSDSGEISAHIMTAAQSIKTAQAL